MTPLNNAQIGVCTLCSTVHVSETDMHDGQECENCGEVSVYSVEVLCDMANAYLSLRDEELGEDAYD